MEYRCISADCHIDLCWMPDDLFVSNATSAMKDRMPYVTDSPEGPIWATKKRGKICLANGKGVVPTASGGRTRYQPGAVDRFDRMAAIGLFTDAEKGIYHPTNPEYRLKDQDRDGVQAEVLYGMLGTGNRMKDPDAAVEFYRIYNDWLADFCSYNPKRLVGLASIPNHDLDAAVAEIHRAAKIGLKGLDVTASFDMVPLWNPYWDPIWKAANETNLAVHFHTIGPPPEPPLPKDASDFFKVASKAARMAGFQLYSGSILGGVIYGGALERFPQLRMVLGESGIGWIPYVLKRMDDEYVHRFNTGLPLKMKPSEYWRRQCRATFQDDTVGIMHLDTLGTETVMWASDYPHGDSVFPDSQEYIKRQFSHLPPATQHKVTCENAGKFYGLM